MRAGCRRAWAARNFRLGDWGGSSQEPSTRSGVHEGEAREHGDLDGAFKSVAEALEATVTRLGIERFGIAGEDFDPTIHEAISHQHSADVTGPTCVSVFQQGYRFKGRILRPAIVAVADPE